MDPRARAEHKAAREGGTGPGRTGIDPSLTHRDTHTERAIGAGHTQMGTNTSAHTTEACRRQFFIITRHAASPRPKRAKHTAERDWISPLVALMTLRYISFFDEFLFTSVLVGGRNAARKTSLRRVGCAMRHKATARPAAPAHVDGGSTRGVGAACQSHSREGVQHPPLRHEGCVRGERQPETMGGQARETSGTREELPTGEACKTTAFA